jgi:hypothetical protein
MEFVPPTHEQTPIRCSACHTRYVSFTPVRDDAARADEYAPDRCACGHLQNLAALPPGKLCGASGDPVRMYHPLNRPN